MPRRLQEILESIEPPAPEHPGKFLLDQVLVPCQISQNQLARMMGVSARRVNEIVLGKRSITAESALRLAEVLGISAKSWMSKQADYDLYMARVPRSERPKHAPRPKRRGRDARYYPGDYDTWAPFEG